MSDLNMRKTKIRMLSSSCMRKETCKRKLCHLRLHGRPPRWKVRGYLLCKCQCHSNYYTFSLILIHITFWSRFGFWPESKRESESNYETYVWSKVSINCWHFFLPKNLFFLLILMLCLCDVWLKKKKINNIN